MKKVEQENKYKQNIGDLGKNPLKLEELLKTAEKIENSVPEMDEFISVTADKDFIYFPNKPPKPRKRANKWRDATEEELERDCGVLNPTS